MCSGIERRELWRDYSVQWDREKGTVEGVQCAGRERRELWRDCSVQGEREKGTVEGLQCAVG